jgi:hypothetical protein
MIEGLSICEIADFADALRRHPDRWRTRIKSPWETLSGFTDCDLFIATVARSWPVFPLTGDVTRLLKILDWNAPILPMRHITRAIPCDELSFYQWA